jgi:cupin 2 domain-containing protein
VNVFEALPPASAEEQFTGLLTAPGLRIERIVSTGQASPPGFWYDQDIAEWVLLLQGEAGLQIAGEPTARRLRAGSYLHLPAHCRHRVEWTSTDPPAIWLAVHHGPAGCQGG